MTDKDLEMIKDHTSAALDTVLFLISVSVALQGPRAIENMLQVIDKVEYESNSEEKRRESVRAMKIFRDYLNDIKSDIKQPEYA